MCATAVPLPLRASACRFCGTPLEHSVLDLGAQPPSNSYLRAADLNRMEPTFPLHAHICGACHLMQLETFHAPQDIFGDYAYFSSYSESWLRHAEAYCEAMIERFGIGPQSHVVEVASNDGYLLQYFVCRDVPVLGVEPAANVARVANARGIPTTVAFMGRATARRLLDEGHAADLVIGNNVLAHVPDLNDFVAALRMMLKPEGIVTIEAPHLLNLIEQTQFDTIYHEHFSYFSFTAAERIFAAHGIRLFDVEELPTHGGSLRLFGCLSAAGHAETPAVAAMRRREAMAGLDRVGTYDGFGDRVRAVKRALLSFAISAKNEGKRIAAYGAAAKGNTLLNFCGMRTDFIDYVVDASPHKQGLFLPGTRIPIVAPERLRETRPDYVLILPWNLKDEITAAHGYIRSWGGRFVVPIPSVEVIG
jgi:2-polyprenyl-3-methyl-5-hydroxy-6-metoxy-1,4-benzoquinol methylase